MEQLKNPKYQTVLFDLDGTLTDPGIGITRCVQYALKKLDYPVPALKELLWFIGPPLRDSFAKILATDDFELIEKAVSLYRERYTRQGIFECELYSGIKQLLEKLHENRIDIVLATSKPEIYARQLLEHYNIEKYFKLIVGSELDGKLSNKNEIIAHIIKKLPEADKSKTIMIGDRFYDINGARENLIDSIGVTYGYGSQKELIACTPTFLADTVSDISNILF